VTKWGELTQRVLQMLDEIGPMTRSEICAHLGQPKDKVSSLVTRLSTDTPKAGRRIHICDYVHDMEGERHYPRAVYALGDKPNKRKPKADHLAVRRRYWARRKLKMTANSVFHLGMTRRETEALIKDRK
jgi:hypothetical protein